MQTLLEKTISKVDAFTLDVWARIEFERSVRLGQFLDGVEGNMRRAVQAGVLAPADARSILDSLPQWFRVLADRGIHEGDRLLYRITGDTLRTRYVTCGGETLVDQIDVGPERRLSVFGSYFAPKSEFRKGLTSREPTAVASSVSTRFGTRGRAERGAEEALAISTAPSWARAAFDRQVLADRCTCRLDAARQH
jgi:hypothetical protein